MEEKYYTPAIEEFHVGFECEVYNGGLDQWEYYLVSNKSWSSNGMWKALRDELEHFRVKYLDRIDVEELEWVFRREDEFHQFFLKDGMRLALSKSNINIIIEIFNEVGEEEFTHRLGTVFSGSIKNKSELKVLLKQLGINE